VIFLKGNDMDNKPWNGYYTERVLCHCGEDTCDCKTWYVLEPDGKFHKSFHDYIQAKACRDRFNTVNRLEYKKQKLKLMLKKINKRLKKAKKNSKL